MRSHHLSTRIQTFYAVLMHDCKTEDCGGTSMLLALVTILVALHKLESGRLQWGESCTCGGSLYVLNSGKSGLWDMLQIVAFKLMESTVTGMAVGVEIACASCIYSTQIVNAWRGLVYPIMMLLHQFNCLGEKYSVSNHSCNLGLQISMVTLWRGEENTKGAGKILHFYPIYQTTRHFEK